MASTPSRVLNKSIHTNPNRVSGKYNLAEARTSDDALEAPGRFVARAVLRPCGHTA